MRDFHMPGRSAVYATNGICATSTPLAAKVAVQTLESGGNAVDAAIAAAVLLGICEPQMTGIGGDCFVLLKEPGSEEVRALNGSGRAPAGLNAADLRGRGLDQMPIHDANAVTVPGAIDAFCRLSAEKGKLGLAASLAPAIHYARNGVPVGPRTAFDWAQSAGDLQGAARDFYLLGGKPPVAGQVFRHERQAEVLERIARDGRAGYYEGEVAQDMVDSLRALGGTHTMDDFAATACDWGDPISGTYKGVELLEHPPNGQGATAILLAGILSHFPLADWDPNSVQRAHVEAEATKLAYDARDRFIADMDYTTRLAHMLDPKTAAALAALIDPARPMADPRKASGAVHKETVYLTVVDRDLMAVSMIYSVFHSFGSCLASSKFGINFQNRGAGFTLESGHPNEVNPGKRPMHTIIPAMLREGGKVTMPFGVMGGAYQSTGHAHVLTNIVDYGMDPQTALDAPRSFAEQGHVKVERGMPEETRAGLADMGHTVQIPDTPIGGAQAIRIDHKNGVLIGASDPRKDGCAIGY